LFDRGISRGETPRLWLDAVAHVVMSRDQRVYRFVQDTRFGRKVLVESMHIGELTDAITRYVAQRLVERERSLTNAAAVIGDPQRDLKLERGRGRRRAIGSFLLGVFAGLAGLLIAAILSAPR
jgi:Pyruvate/2-oxoacid:ferredoxin oxidoreductase gamma subunit